MDAPKYTWQQKSLFWLGKKHAAGQDTGSSIKVSNPRITTGQTDAKVPQASWVDRSAATGGLKLPLGP